MSQSKHTGNRSASLRAALWATLVVVPASASFDLSQNTSVLHGHIILGLIAYVLSLPLFPGVILTGILVAIVTLIGNAHAIALVASHQFTVVTPMLNWLMYFGVLVLIFRWRKRAGMRG